MGYISIEDEKLYYNQSGTGKRIVLAFHGYGENSSLFAGLEQYIGQEYTLLSLDLPHHGHSSWPQDKPFTRQHLISLITAVKNTYDINKISLIGYSLGGRICLSILELMPESVDKIILIASDGLEVNKYYRFYTSTEIGKKLFRHMLTKPELYLNILKLLRRLRIVDASRYKFVMHSLQSHHSRKFLLQVWPCLAELVPKPAKIKQLINQYQVPVIIFMGTYDRVMPPAIATRFAADMKTVEVNIIPQGHRLLNSATIGQIASKLL